MSEDWLARYGLRNDIVEQFPEFPELTAFWAPVRVEPIAMSGELLTVAVAILGEPGTKPRIISALSDDVMTAVFGVHGMSLMGIARTASASLLDHLEKTGDFVSWLPPVAGVTLGPVEEGQGDSVEEIAKQALRASASLSAMTEAFRTQAKKSEQNRLVTSMRKAMVVLAPELSDRFHVPVPVTIRSTQASVYCDYFSSNLAINMCSMGPGRNLQQQFEAFFSRVCRLDQLRGNDALIEHNQKPHILLAVPSEEAIDRSADKSNIRFLQEKLVMAQDLTEKHKFTFSTVPTPEQGARYIIGLEKAA